MMSGTMDGEEGTAQRQESPTPTTDLLGLDEIRRNSAANQHQKQDNEQAMIEVKVVELGSALYGGEPKSYRGPRKQSSISRLLAGTSSVSPGGYGRARGGVRSGEKMYNGRMNQASQQQPQHEQQQQLEQQQQRRQPDNIDKARQQQVANDHSKFGAAPWANIRRRSRDGADKIRRRLTSGPTTERVQQAQKDSEEQQAEIAQLRLIRRQAKQKEELERLEKRSQRKELLRQSSSRRNCTTSAMIVPFQKQMLEEIDDDSTIISGKRNEHRTENQETNDKHMNGLEGNGNGHDDNTNVKEQGNNETISMREALAKSLNVSEGFANDIAPSAVRRPMEKRRSLDSSLSLRLTASLITGEGTYRVEDPAEKLPDRQPGRQRRSLDSSMKLAEATEALILPHDTRPRRLSSSCDTNELSNRLDHLFKPTEEEIIQRATGEISKRSEDDMMLDWNKKFNSRENLKECGGGVDYGPMKRKDSTNGMDMLDKMDIKKNNESDAVKTIPGRFNRHSPDVKTIDSTREKGQSRTGDVPEVRENRRRHSSIDFRPDHGARSQREESNGRTSKPSTRLNKQVPSPVAAKWKQKRLSTILNSEHRARSQNGDEESSKKGSQKSSQKSSQKRDPSQQRGSQASSEKGNNRSDKRRMSTKLNVSEHRAHSQSEDEESSKKISKKKTFVNREVLKQQVRREIAGVIREENRFWTEASSAPK